MNQKIIRLIKNILGMDLKPGRFYNFIQEKSFGTDFLGIFINPFYIARKGLYKNIKILSPEMTGKILDVGCGTKPYKHLFKYERYDGLEIDTPKNKNNIKADFFYDGKIFPFQNNLYDSILCNQVLEHVFEPVNFLKEINRVMKKEGYLLLTVPFIWDEHEQPIDYGRYSSFGIKYLLQKNGFEVISSKKSVNSLALIFQILNGYIYKKTLTSSLYLNILLRIIFMSPVTIIGISLSKIFPKSQDIYLDNIVLAKKI